MCAQKRREKSTPRALLSHANSNKETILQKHWWGNCCKKKWAIAQKQICTMMVCRGVNQGGCASAASISQLLSAHTMAGAVLKSHSAIVCVLSGDCLTDGLSTGVSLSLTRARCGWCLNANSREISRGGGSGGLIFKREHTHVQQHYGFQRTIQQVPLLCIFALRASSHI